ncbi:protease modulator HflC [Chromobacterium sp. IIBBL 290-4]|uniref:protease modulator HflC n=1 Tax=Chromobacterium sp. IIBBL 290-4 TaxID=2953890 RepID=UPI0020B770E8|nr:protease modulator HflC [Chromobacterium sp. IIBBL 290-4]UTH74609.1 protease modulator HflC [Chromobacterium sp. IIBBL 290-4]
MMDKQWRGIGWAAGIAAIWLALSAQYTLNEGQKALVVRLGAPVDVDGEPGLKFKLPLIDSVQYYDTRLQMLAPPPEQVILGDEKRLEVETYTRYCITDTLRFYQALRTEEQARAQLAQLVSTSLRRELGKVPLSDLLSARRAAIVAHIQQEVAERARPMGLQVTEVQLHRADLPLETSQAIYDRMKSARQQEAKELRAQGAEWAQQIQAKADRDRTVILSEAQRQSAITHGEADAEAGRILAQAFSKDPKFYKFYRSLQTYRQSLADSAPTVVLSPDSALLRDLRNGPAGGKP